ncbi:MAG: DUF6531 domain-containing protein [Pseudonocardiaceae bacterium]
MLRWRRTYSSRHIAAGPLGRDWSCWANARCTRDGDTLTYHRPDGQVAVLRAGEGILTGLRYVAGGELVALGFIGSLPVIGWPVHVATGCVQAVATMANGDFDLNHIARNFANGPTTTFGLGLGLIGGAHLSYDKKTGMWVAAGSSTGYKRAGTAYGSTFVTGSDAPGERTLRHESIHAEQYARFGGGAIFPILYLWEEHNHPGRDNEYEQEAGLEDGGYR